MRSIICLIVLFAGLTCQAQDEVGLFDFWEFYTDAENCMYKTSCALAFKQLDQRKSELAELKSKQEYLHRQALVKEKLKGIIGPMPQKTPLNAQVTGVIKRKDFRVEKILFESTPGYYVTAALFLPTSGKGKLPVIIYASGHTLNGFRSETYQHIIINLVSKGFAVFAFDPIGQGERLQYFEQDGLSPRFNSATIEHSYPGVQCYISGYSPTNYFVWDVMRGIDYLISRKEIDPQRIGMTGRSGGGTQTAYAAAFDDRIVAAAPECYITNMEYVLKSIGPQDAEQNLYRMIEEGLDHADLLEVRAPKPGLMITTTGDFFSIQGARDTFLEVKQFYTALGAADDFSMVEDDAGHTSTKSNRESMYAFFQKYLNNPGSAEDLEVEIFPEKDLWSTKTGQVASMKGETLFSLNKQVVQRQVSELNTARKTDSHLMELASSVKEISGFEPPKNFEPSIFSGRFRHNEYHIEKYLIAGGGEYLLPLVLYKPTTNNKNQLVLILDEHGLDHAANQGQMVHFLVQQGYSVLIADLPGIGSLGPGYLKGDAYVDNTSFNQWFAGILTGKSIVAMRAEDIVRIVHFVKQEISNIEMHCALSTGVLGSELLHASTFEKSIERIGLINPFLSYAEIATTRQYQPSFIPSIVSGALNSYDLADLIAGLCPNPIFIANPLTPGSMLVDSQQLNSTLSFANEVYGANKVPANLKVVNGVDDNQVLSQLLQWLQ